MDAFVDEAIAPFESESFLKLAAEISTFPRLRGWEEEPDCGHITA